MEGFDAAFVAVGAHLGKRAYIPAGSAARMLDAVAMLRDVEGGEAPQLGRRVAVYGGGNTAFDAARTAKRLGAQESVVVYRRTRDRMPAHDSELQEALAEGVLVKWLSTVRHADGGKLDARADGTRRQRLPAAHRRAGGARGRLARARAGPGVRSRAARAPRRRRDQRRRGPRRPGPDDRAPGRVLRRRHRPGRAHGDHGDRPRPHGRCPHRRLAAGHERHARRAGEAGRRSRR